jgi:hypothetical protein
MVLFLCKAMAKNYAWRISLSSEYLAEHRIKISTDVSAAGTLGSLGGRICGQEKDKEWH